jgi:hypothetical protein
VLVTTSSELGLLRLSAQGVAGPRYPTAADAVRRLTAVQAQAYPGALTSVALRTGSRLRKEIETALDAGEVVRSWPMRGTLHLTAAEDLPWLLELLTPRILAGRGRRWAQLGLTESAAARAREAVEDALSGGGRLGRAQLLDAMAAAGVDTGGQRGYHLLGYLAQTGTLCLGPTAGGEQLFVLLGEWVPTPRRLDRDQALGELALRYFGGHGPATVADLARWAGLPVRDVRAGIAAVRDRLTALEVDGVEYLLDPATPDRLAACRAEAAGVFLLPGFDEFVLGYGDRSAVLAPQFADRIAPGGNGVFRPTVVHRGRVVGTWRFTGQGARRRLTAEPFTAFDRATDAAIAAAAADLP